MSDRPFILNDLNALKYAFIKGRNLQIISEAYYDL